MNHNVILVDEQDRELGVMEKIMAHEKGLLHRAVSVFVFNEEGKVLLQKRAMQKYHSPGLWTNTACSHPVPGETTLSAAKRRLREEMGLELNLHYIFDFLYRVEFSNGLVEHELDHVFIGYGNTNPKPDKEEVMDWKWYDPSELSLLVKIKPDEYTEWFKLCYERVLKYVTKTKQLNFGK